MQIVKEDIYQMVSNILEIDVEVVSETDENEDFSVLGMTSISAIQLVVMLEVEYNFDFKDEDIVGDKFNTFKKLFDLLESY